SMVLRFTQGKEEFVDWTLALQTLASKVKAQPIGRGHASLQLLSSKIEELLAIVALAKKSVVATAV
ncbi:MAG TPA: hypothetical protein VLA25_03060, partial [Methylotenera sp.]|nr:hypothetical protein [Methylotenera sp.]